MPSIARSMKRHGLTAKPSLRLASAVMSGDTKYYLFDISESGRKHTVAAAEFWRGSGTFPDPGAGSPAAPAPAPVAVQPAPEPAPAPVPAEPEPVREPDPEPEPEPIEAADLAEPESTAHVRVRDMQPGDVVTAANATKGKPREVIRVVPGTPYYALHYVWPGSLALRTSQHLPGARFNLLRRASS